MVVAGLSIVQVVLSSQTVRALLRVMRLPGSHLFGGSLLERLVCWRPRHFAAFARLLWLRPLAPVEEEVGPFLRRAFRRRGEVIPLRVPEPQLSVSPGL